MSDASIDSATHEALRTLIDDAAAADGRSLAAHRELIDAVEATLGQLDEWTERLASHEATEAEREFELQAQRQAADEHRRRLEHDLKLARARVHDLEKALQERTEELLRAQASNNALAAELQAAELNTTDLDGDDGEFAGDAPEPTDPPETNGDNGGSVTERFAKLRSGR